MLASHRRVTGNIAAEDREQAVSRAAGISDKTWVGLINGKRKGARDKRGGGGGEWFRGACVISRDVGREKEGGTHGVRGTRFREATCMHILCSLNENNRRQDRSKNLE